MPANAFPTPSVPQFEPSTRLVDLEDHLLDVLLRAARQLARELNIPRRDFWRRALPESLVRLLLNLDQRATNAVVRWFLEQEETGQKPKSVT